MATNEEWWEYFYELQETIKKIQGSDLPDDVKEEITTSRKTEHRKKIFLRVITKSSLWDSQSIRIWRQQFKEPV